MGKDSALESLSRYWREQADHWSDQEKAWHDVASFCRQVKAEIAKQRRIINAIP